MSPNIATVRKKLGYPLYAADFDPLNHDFLLVGGGGGSSSTGVPNKISLVDASRRSELKEVVDIELSKEEDSVSSLRVAQSEGQSLLAYAGINSSESVQKAGKNEHFRSFSVAIPVKRNGTDSQEKKAPSITQPLAKTSLFRPAPGPKYESYQRVLRLSPARLNLENTPRSDTTEKAGSRKLRKRLAGIASGLGSPNEILVFPATPNPIPSDILSRINLEKSEAADLDIVDVDHEKQAFALAYCTDSTVFFQPLSANKKGNVPEPVSVHEIDSNKAGKLRGIRFITARHLVLLQNRPARSGVDLVILKTDKEYTQANVVLRKRLGKMKVAVGLDTCTLSAQPDGSQQFVVGIAGQDSSIQVLVIDWLPGAGLGKFQQFAAFSDVHQGPITRIVFSTFLPPPSPISSKTPPQYVRLASVGVDQNVVVHTIPLLPYPASGTGNEHPRYVLIQPSEILSMVYNIFMAFLTLIVVGMMLVTFMEVRGAIPPMLGSTQWLPRSWQEKYARPYVYTHGGPGPVIPDSMPAMEPMAEKVKSAGTVVNEFIAKTSSIPSVEDVQDSLSDLLHLKRSDPEHPELKDRAIVIRDAEAIGSELVAEIKHEAEIVKEETLKKWEHLTEKEKKTWKQKLVDAGHWTEKQGESVLKGILFSELAGIVANLQA